MIDLAADHLAIVRDILARHLPDHEVRAFGSRVRGTSRPTSDLDLVVMTATPLEIGRIADLLEAFSEAPLPFKVDVIDWAGCNDVFRDLISDDFISLHDGRKSAPADRQ